MATPKQIKYIQFACSRLGRRVLSPEEIQALSRDGIDRLIKSLKAVDPQKNSSSDVTTNYRDNGSDTTRDPILGMCFKLYVKETGVVKTISNESETHRVVQDLYNAFKKIRDKVRYAEKVNGGQGGDNEFAARH
jgi:hypothetical protein